MYRSLQKLQVQFQGKNYETRYTETYSKFVILVRRRKREIRSRKIKDTFSTQAERNCPKTRKKIH